MELSDLLTIIAILSGPILAVQAEKYLQRRRDDRNRRLNIFKTLMATRGSALSFAHVEALNRIDLEFSDDKKYEKVISSWKEYFDNLGQKNETNEQFTIWAARNEELLANLLYEMGHSLGYTFDKVLIKRNIYSPIGHERIERENEMIRKGILEVLDGDRIIPMTLIVEDEIQKKQIELQDAMLKHYNKE